MNRVQKTIRRTLAKAFTFFAPMWGGRLTWFGLPDERNYATLVGDGFQNSIVAATVMWVARTFPEAPPAMWTVDPVSNIRQRIPRHPLVKLLMYPTADSTNPGGYYSGVLLWMATIVSWIIDGNAYWLKGRSKAGRVVQLWYVPHWMIEPYWPLDGSKYISYYNYRVGAESRQLDPRDVVHFRYGLDPDNPRKGRSPLAAVLREIFTDEEAARFSAAILKKVGIPGVIISPAKGSPAPRTSQADLDGIKAKFNETFVGDNRGDAMVLGGPTDVQMFGFFPQQMDLSALRDVPEERITAALGIPAAVVGFGAGLQQTKVGKTMSELRDQAWENGIIPAQRILGSEIQTQLVPEFETDIELNQFGFDLSHVKVFQDELDKMATRWGTLVDKKIAKRSEARAAFELVVDPIADDVYIEATASATSGAPGGSGSDQSQIDELTQQVSDLQDQLQQSSAQAATIKAVTDTAREALKTVGDATRQVPEKTEVHLHVDKGAIDARTMKQDLVLPPGLVQLDVDARTTVAAGAVQVETPVTIEAGAVQVTNEAPDPVGFDVVRNADGIVGVRPRA